MHYRLSCLTLLQEADIRPFRGMLLGLFFVTTGASLDVQLLVENWPIVVALLGGLLAVKVGIIGTVSQYFGLTRYQLSLSAWANLASMSAKPARSIIGEH